MAKSKLRALRRRLASRKLTVSVAESCSGGLLSQLLTNAPGSSSFFCAGLVLYANQAKSRILKIPPALIKNSGAVSRAVALRMSESTRRLMKTDLGVGITGIAGPSGGSARKPVGTVFIAVSRGPKNTCRRFLFRGSRSAVRSQAAQKAIDMLLGLIK